MIYSPAQTDVQAIPQCIYTNINPLIGTHIRSHAQTEENVPCRCCSPNRLRLHSAFASQPTTHPFSPKQQHYTTQHILLPNSALSTKHDRRVIVLSLLLVHPHTIHPLKRPLRALLLSQRPYNFTKRYGECDPASSPRCRRGEPPLAKTGGG